MGGSLALFLHYVPLTVEPFGKVTASATKGGCDAELARNVGDQPPKNEHLTVGVHGDYGTEFGRLVSPLFRHGAQLLNSVV
jgi:hypothetical protein